LWVSRDVFDGVASGVDGHLGTVEVVSAHRVREGDPFWTVPRAAALGLVLLAIGAVIFLEHFPYSAPQYGRAQDRVAVLETAGYVYEGVEAGPQRTGDRVPIARTVADMRTAFRDDGWYAHVTVHGSHIMVRFPKEPVLCVWVPVIVNGPKEPVLVAC
jgi:hypothetical protein